MTDHMAQIERIKSKLEQVVDADPELKVFGASCHRYELNPPASLNEVKAFEQEYQIELPDCYRSFILNIGNGGNSFADSAAGPFYGIYPLGSHVDELIDYELETNLQKETPLTPRISEDDWEKLCRTIEEEEDISDEGYDEEIAKLFCGLLPIGSQGCTYLHALVLNGKYSGRVVNLDQELQKPKFAYEKNFLDWYERWLDEIISGELTLDSASWFGYSMGGTAEEIIEGYLDSESIEEKTDYLAGLLNKHELKKSSTDIIKNELKTTTNSLKKLLLQVLCKFDYTKAKPYLLGFLKTDLLTVYRFLFWYAKGKSNEWVEPITQNMHRITDAETLRFCTYLLDETQQDYSALIIPFASHKNENLRSSAIYTLGRFENKKRFLDIFIAGLESQSNGIIHSSLQALSGVVNSKLLKHYQAIAKRFPEEQDYILSNLNHRLADYGLNNLSIQHMKPESLKWQNL